MREAAAQPTPDGAPGRAHCAVCHGGCQSKSEGSASARIGVTCGGVAGVLLLPRKRVLLHPGTPAAVEVSPTEFERLGGKATYKRWRSSIRVADASAEAWVGRPVGDWLIAHGFDAPVSAVQAKRSRLAACSCSDSGDPSPLSGSFDEEEQQHVAAAAARALLAHSVRAAQAAAAQPAGAALSELDALQVLRMIAHLHRAMAAPPAAPPAPAGAAAALAAAVAAAAAAPSPDLAQRSSGPLAETRMTQEPTDSDGDGEGKAPAGSGSGQLPPSPPQEQADQRWADEEMQALPGDGDPRVAAMAAYLAGTTQQLPPRHLLPPAAVNPAVAGRAVDLRALFRAVVGRGGHLWVTLTARWGEVLGEAGLGGADPAAGAEVAAQALYENVLLRFERMYSPEAWLAATGRPSPVAGSLDAGSPRVPLHVRPPGAAP
ncbi:hypothetical protein Rsub_09486 [Raphidocelis subcapitata]|uniref:ARID domain-containing protein n=1 Tax=Raphidocelis subcapitata TaxID=307507 RepID=A0A2V0PA67_9CHLO|nr:hypothetical protein Rsub_09486 [Raphidocelis subcapitata]|eukprot:GBF96744.1 hypothetical protein Rsub_09486 [Raphidocelis subcapitata]